jgi:AcrR family transcriptional regulator
MIVVAALPLLVERGDKVTTAEIAAVAGIAEGTIFRVFASKEELIDAVIDRVLDPGPTEEALSALDADAGLEATVTSAVRILQRRMAEVWQLISSVGLHFHRRSARRPDFESPALTRLMHQFDAELETGAPEAARILRSVTLAMTHPALTDQPHAPEGVARQFLYGVHKCGANQC